MGGREVGGDGVGWDRWGRVECNEMGPGGGARLPPPHTPPKPHKFPGPKAPHADLHIRPHDLVI